MAPRLTGASTAIRRNGVAVIPALLLAAVAGGFSPASGAGAQVQHIVCLPRACHVARANGEIAARGAGVLSFVTVGAATVTVAPCGSAPGKVGAR
jgi:hypothetical protein